MTSIIPFPASRRRGHAVKVALLLKGARTQREAQHLLSRTMKTFTKQLEEANISKDRILSETASYLAAITAACRECNSAWAPLAILHEAYSV